MSANANASTAPSPTPSAKGAAADSGPTPLLEVSMMKVFQPKLKHMEQYLTLRGRELDEAMLPWDIASVDHSILLTTSTELRQEMADYKRALLQLMKALWLEQTKRYQTYRNSVSNTLTRRHFRELECLFAHLRFQATPPDDAEREATLSSNQQAVKAHLNEAGFRYISDDVALNNVGNRQVKERQSLETITKAHHTMLQEATKQDQLRLTKAIHKTMDFVNRILHLVDQKITMAHQASATPNLYKKFQPQERKDSAPAMPMVQDALVHPPIGSVMDVPGGKAPSHSPSSSSKGGGDDGDSTENERSRKSASGHQALGAEPLA